MTDFNDLVNAQLSTAHSLLGGISGEYRRGNQIIAPDCSAIIDEDVIVATEDGLGVQKTIVASFLKSDISTCEEGDEFISGSYRYIVNHVEVEDEAGFDCYVRKLNA